MAARRRSATTRADHYSAALEALQIAGTELDQVNLASLRRQTEAREAIKAARQAVKAAKSAAGTALKADVPVPV